MADNEQDTRTARGPESPGGTRPRVRWDSSKLQSSYANVCSITSTRDEIVLSFGLNQTWEPGSEEIEIELSNRIIVSPSAAKRMARVLDQVLAQYEARHGPLPADAG